MISKPLMIIGSLWLLQSCAVPIQPVDNPIPLPEKFSVAGQIKPEHRWWLAFNDTQLNGLMDTAFNHNFTVLSAYNRLEQAQSLAIKAGSELIPSLNGYVKGQKTFTDKQASSQWNLGLSLSYELDLWGRIRANQQAGQLDVRVAEESVKTALISLSAEVALTWVRLIEQRSQLQLLAQQIQTNQNNVEIIKSRFAGSKASAADVFQQQQLLEARIGDQSQVLASIEVLSHQLAVLTGQMPKQIHLPTQSQLPLLPAQPQTGLPSELIQRRPDVRMAYFKVQSADQRIAAAIADRFPKLSLSTSMETHAPDLHNLFNNWLATLAGNLVLPLIDGGRRLAEVDRSRAVAKEALNNYARILQQAVQEVEDALIQEQQQHLLALSLLKQHQLSQQATQQIRLRYLYGATDFLRVLNSQLSQQTLARLQLSAQRQLLEYRIQLYRALAGYWSPTQDTQQNER